VTPLTINLWRILDEDTLKQWFFEAKAERFLTERRDRSEIPKPSTPFADVQCHRCGMYVYWKEADDTCGNCEAVYDWRWNVETGRIEPEHAPIEV
jgi:hypothetical protein